MGDGLRRLAHLRHRYRPEHFNAAFYLATRISTRRVGAVPVLGAYRLSGTR